MRLFHAIFVILLCLIGGPLKAQNTTQRQNIQDATSLCELHVWPASSAHSSYSGWFHGGAIDGDKRGIKGYPNMYADELDMQHQIDAFRQIDWKTWSDIPNLVITIHENVTGSDDDRLRKTKLVPNSSACYRELIISSVLIEAATFSSRSVRLIALMKKFGSTGNDTSTFMSMTRVDVAIPDKSNTSFEKSIRNNVKEAFMATVNKFMVAQSFH